MSPSVMYGTMDRIEGAGLIRRVGEPAGRWEWRLHVTAGAHTLSEKLRCVGDEMIPEAFAGIGAADGQRVLDAVLALTARITSELAAAAGGVCLVALPVSLGLPSCRDHRGGRPLRA